MASIGGSSGNDTLNGASGSDSYYGGDGNDTITGGAAYDTLYGGGGDDVLTGDDDTRDDFFGGAGNDTIFAGDADGNQADGGDGNDTIFGGAGSDTLDGGTGNDTLEGGGGNDTLDGGSGNDTLEGGAGRDSLTGGDGNDTLYGGADRDTLNGGAGDDTLFGGADSDRLYSSAGSDTFYGGDGGDGFYIDPGHGAITIFGGDEGGDVDFIVMGAFPGGVDVDFTANEAGTITTADGVVTFSEIEWFYLTDGADTLDASDSTDGHLVFGLDGDDEMIGSSGFDDFYGGTGNDTLSGGAGNDNLDAGDGNDTAYGGTGNDTLLGGTGEDSLYGGAGNDFFSGGSGNDLLYGGDGEDTVYGNAGNDTLYGGAGNDTFYGGDDADTIYGGAGDSVVGGEGGDDSDVLIVESGSLVSYGGGNNEAGTVALASGGTLTFSEIESIRFDGAVDGTAGDDVMGAGYVDTDGDSIDGADGDDDLVFGGAGNDSINAGAGNDTVVAGAGNDTLEGSDGADRLYGESGSDDLFGGAGNDTLTGDNSGANLITNGDFGSDFDGWTVNNPTGGFGPTMTGSGQVRFNRGGEATYGDSIEQDFNAPVGVEHTVSLELSESGRGNSTQTFRIDILDDAGTVIATETHTVSNNATLPVSFTFTPVSDTSTLVITNTDAATTAQSDGLVDNVSIVASDTGTGDDTLSGGAGDDMLEGGGGNDTLFGGDGNDSLLGGAGNDSLSGGGHNDTIFGGDGDDSIDGGDYFDVIYGGDGNDTIEAGEEASFGDNDTIYGGAGDDVITSRETSDLSRDMLYGGAGNDTISTMGGGATLDGGTGDDTLTGAAGNDSLFGGDGNDSLTGGDGDDSLSGGDGNDSLAGGAGNDSMAGGTGDDTLAGGIGNDTLTGGTGNDDIDGGTGNDTLSGEAGNDTLDGGEGDDSIDGGAGDDSIVGGLGDDRIDGGAGNDTISDESSANVLIQMDFETDAGGVAVDTSGNANNGVYQGDANAGGTGWTGAPGDSALDLDGVGDYVEIPHDPDFGLDQGTVSVRFNADSLQNGALVSRDSNGFDGGGHIQIEMTSSGAIEVRLQSDTDSYTMSTASGVVSADTWHEVTVTFGPEGMVLYVDGVAQDTNAYTGGISGNSEPWTLGADQMRSDDGTANNLENFFDGQIDDFTLYSEQLTANEVAAASSGSLGGGDDIMTGGAGDDTLDGGIGNDTLDGGDDNDDIDGGAGNDTLFGEAGNDTLDGGEGDDSIAGGTGEDTLDGGTGNDTLQGGDGNDTLTGGSGNDTFQFVRDGDADVVTDFSVNDSDGDGKYDDQLDVSDLRDQEGNPVNAWDVQVQDQGGDALLIFPGGETILLQGVSPAQMQTAGQKFAAGIPCFTTGTMIRTPGGEVPVEMLRPGDRVLTRDNGPQPLIWVGLRRLGPEDLAARPDMRPVVFAPGALGQEARLLVSPQHGMLVDHEGEEMLARATHLARLPGGKIRVAKGVRRVTYVHLMFETHQVIWGNGLPSESFYPGPWGLAAMDGPALLEIAELFPDAVRLGAEAGYGQTARDFAGFGVLRESWQTRGDKNQARARWLSEPAAQSMGYPRSNRLH